MILKQKKPAGQTVLLQKSRASTFCERSELWNRGQQLKICNCTNLLVRTFNYPYFKNIKFPSSVICIQDNVNTSQSNSSKDACKFIATHLNEIN